MDELQFTNAWTNRLLDHLSETGEGKRFAGAEQAIEACAEMCFAYKGMTAEFAGISDLDGLIGLFRAKWGWKVEYDAEAGVLLCDENKAECLCPIVRSSDGAPSKAICCCTRGMLKRIFAEVLHRDVQAEVLRSVIRDGKSCVYRITL